MLRESGFLKNKKCIVLLCVEIMLLLIGIFIAMNRGGVIADSQRTPALLEEGIALAPGVYTAKIHYETQENYQNTFRVQVEVEKEKYLRSNIVSLPAGIMEQTCQFYLLQSVENLRVVVEENGATTLQVRNIEIEDGYETGLIFSFWIIILSLLIDITVVIMLYHKKRMIPMEKQMAMIAGIGTVLIASLPILVDYVFFGADLIFHLARIEALAQSMLSGAFWARIEPYWLSGHGYANSIFYGDTFLLLPALLRVIGFDLSFTYRMFVLMVNIVTASIAYISFRKCFRSIPIGILGMVLYTLSPYRIYNIYNRAAVGEYVAMMFMPLLLWGFFKIFTEDVQRKDYRYNWLIPVLGFSGVIQSHALSCEMVGVFVTLLCLVLWRKVFRKQTFVVLMKTVIYTIILNAWFLIPFADLMLSDKYYLANNANVFIQKRGIPAALMFFTVQNSGASSLFTETGLIRAEPINMGIALLLATMLWLVIRFKYRKSDTLKKSEIKKGDALFALGCIALFMSTCYFPWDWLSSTNKVAASLVGALQFPTRLTVIVTICFTGIACVASGFLIRYAVSKKIAYGAITGLGIVSVIFGMYQLNDTLYTREASLRLYSVENIGTNTVLGAEYLPWDASMEHMTYHGPVCSRDVVLSDYQKDNLSVSAYVETGSGGDSYVEFPMLYYKGYQAEAADTGEPLQTVKGDNADVRVLLPENFSGNIQCSYQGMWYWHMAVVFSVLFGAGIADRLWREKCKNRKRRKL